jgi:hypothetical protein
LRIGRKASISGSDGGACFQACRTKHQKNERHPMHMLAILRVLENLFATRAPKR